MSVLLVGLSHHSAPIPVLERVAVGDDSMPRLLRDLQSAPHISEAMIISTCNRIEIYVVVDSFHGALTEVGTALAEHSGIRLPELTRHVYVRYSEAAVEHLFSVASGLDSMVVGEQQIIGQIRTAYAAADTNATVGRVLHDLAQRSLKVGKRVHTETRIDSAGASVVSVALDRAGRTLGAGIGALAGRTAVVVGAGAMGGLAAAHLGRAGVGRVVVANRTRPRADRLAEITREAGVAAHSVDIDDLADALRDADVLVACTGAVETVVGTAVVRAAERSPARPLVVCDLGLPRDVDAEVGTLPGVTVIDIETLRHDPATDGAAGEAADARAIVAEELSAYLLDQQVAQVTPTVAALRRHAAALVAAELGRLDGRLPEDVDDRVRAEVRSTVNRVVDKLLHTPTVRVKQLAADPGGSGYADALRELFALPAGTPSSVTAGLDLPADELVGRASRSDFRAAGIGSDDLDAARLFGTDLERAREADNTRTGGAR